MTASTQRRVRAGSSSTKKATPAEQRAKAKAKLKLIDPVVLRAQARRRLAALAICGVVIAGMFGVALVHAKLVQRQQQLDDLRDRIAAAEADRSRLERDVVIASAPESIVARATDLGMVRASDPVYIFAVTPVAS